MVPSDLCICVFCLFVYTIYPVALAIGEYQGPFPIPTGQNIVFVEQSPMHTYLFAAD